MKQDKNDLLTGSVLKKLLRFFFPIALGTLFQQLYNAVDAFVVSKFVGTNALASVGGSPAVLSNLVIGFFVALTGGCAVVIAQDFGAGEKEKVREGVKTSFVFCAVLGVVVGALVIVLSPQILRLMKTTEETFDGSLLYQRIYFSGTVLLLVFNMGSGILRAVGDSKFPFLCLVIGCAVNIGSDCLFVIVFHMGIAGVAWATVIAEAVSTAMICLKLLTAKKDCKLVFKGVRFDFGILKSMLKIGIPSGLQSSMYGISNLILQIGVNDLGTLVVASWAMSGKVDGIFWAVSNAFGTAVTTFVGQNYGAKNLTRIKECAKKSFITLLLLTVSISALLMGAGKWIIGILTNDIYVIDTTYTIMSYFVPFYVLWSVIEVTNGILRGIGDTVAPSVIQAVGICLLRIIWVYTVFRVRHTLFYLSLSYSISWFVTDIAIGIYYFVKSKKIFSTEKNASFRRK